MSIKICRHCDITFQRPDDCPIPRDRCGCEVDASDKLSGGSYRCDECFTFFAELNWYEPDNREKRIEDYLMMKREDI